MPSSLACADGAAGADTHTHTHRNCAHSPFLTTHLSRIEEMGIPIEVLVINAMLTKHRTVRATPSLLRSSLGSTGAHGGNRSCCSVLTPSSLLVSHCQSSPSTWALHQRQCGALQQGNRQELAEYGRDMGSKSMKKEIHHGVMRGHKRW